MTEFDLDVARTRTKRLVRIYRIRGLRGVLVPITAYFASIVTIFSIWFMRSGSFEFRPEYWSDWLIVAILTLIAYGGIRMIVKELSISERFVVKRSELYDLNAVARTEADLSVTIIGGDLSWLKEDYESLRSFKQSSPAVKVRVYYDRSRIPYEMKDLIKQLDVAGVDLTPYPNSVSPQLRCMLIDREIQDNAKLYTYTPFQKPLISESRDKQRFIWQEYGPDSVFLKDGVIPFIMAIESSRTVPILLGVCGTNNVGKTRFSSRLHEILSKKFNARLFDDEFRMAGGGTKLEDNFIILFSQILNEIKAEGDVCIFDRTIVDTLCFLHLKSQPDDSIFHMLAPKVAATIREFDIIVDLRKSPENYSEDTKLVTGSERKFVRETLDRFFATYGIEAQEVVLDVNRFEESLEIASNEIAGKVVEIFQRQKYAG